jgi:anhydro-N-acetylmuramic acid kinase
MNEYIAIGIMSGTSLDGLDIALCKFLDDSITWKFDIEQAATIDYTKEWKYKLENAPNLSAYQLIQLHREYGHYIGIQVNNFVSKLKFKPMLIASHGHTVFHEPENKINFQVGDGASIAAKSGITTVSEAWI